MVKKLEKALYWAPRILSIIFIIFLSLFALDALGEPGPWYLVLVGLFMHLLPSLILIILVIVAWKWELVGGILFIMLSLIFTVFFNTYREWQTLMLISFPVFLVGALYLVHYYFKKNQ